MIANIMKLKIFHEIKAGSEELLYGQNNNVAQARLYYPCNMTLNKIYQRF